jgi:hypothetical protein
MNNPPASAAPVARSEPRLPLADPLVPTLFHEDWWLDVASGGRWREVEVRLDHTRVGRLPFLATRHCGWTALGMPPLTHLLGPAVDEGSGNASTRMARRLRLQRALIDQLPRSANFRQTLHYANPDAIAFQAAGFIARVQFTYEIAPADERTLWQGLAGNTSKIIRKSQNEEKQEDWPEPEAFAAFFAANLEAKGATNFYQNAVIARVCGEALARGRGRIIAARNAGGGRAGAIFVAWDQRAMYYLMASRDPATSRAGTVGALIWEAIRHAATHGLRFDFDGVASAGAARFYAGFGGQVRPRFVVIREGGLFRFAQCVRRRLRGQHANNFV